MNIYEFIQAFYESVTTEKRVIGKSLFGRELYAVKIGNGYPVGIATYALHGREFITAKLAPYHYCQGVTGTLWLLPLTNPDGALLSELGIESVPNAAPERAWLSSLPPETLRLWKANGRGVDLNVNFAARWGAGVKNVKDKGAENCIGQFPFSEPETLAIKKFTETVRPDYTLSYHTKGEEIYWHFHQSPRTCPRDRRLAELVSRSTGYPLREAEGSVGGYKDWCIEKYAIPAFTVEVGRDSLEHPIGEASFGEILKRNRSTPSVLSAAIAKLRRNS